jgi:hypothetical protein
MIHHLSPLNLKLMKDFSQPSCCQFIFFHPPPPKKKKHAHARARTHTVTEWLLYPEDVDSSSSETLVPIYPTTRRHIPEGRDLKIHHPRPSNSRRFLRTSGSEAP